MRVTGRWIDSMGKNGRMPGKFGTVYDAEIAAKEFLAKYPTVVRVSISHETGGHVIDVKRSCQVCGGQNDVQVMPDPFTEAQEPEATDHDSMSLCPSCATARFEES